MEMRTKLTISIVWANGKFFLINAHAGPWGAPTDGRCYGNSRYVALCIFMCIMLMYVHYVALCTLCCMYIMLLYVHYVALCRVSGFI